MLRISQIFKTFTRFEHFNATGGFNSSYVWLEMSSGYLWGLTIYSQVENTCMPHHFTNRGGWGHKTSLTPPLFMEVHVSSQESEVWYISLCIWILWPQTSPVSEMMRHASIFNLRVNCQPSHITGAHFQPHIRAIKPSCCIKMLTGGFNSSYVWLEMSSGYMWGLTIYSQVENTCMPHHFTNRGGLGS
jgi:hypothetical protein